MQSFWICNSGEYLIIFIFWKKKPSEFIFVGLHNSHDEKGNILDMLADGVIVVTVGHDYGLILSPFSQPGWDVWHMKGK